jgi:hypothetical protein
MFHLIDLKRMVATKKSVSFGKGVVSGLGCRPLRCW